MKSIGKWIRKRNPYLKWLLGVFLIVTAIVTSMACRYAYVRQRSGLLNELDVQLAIAANEYRNITCDFWEIYLPVVSDSSSQEVLVQYFSEEDDGPVTLRQDYQLTKVLSRMAEKNKYVQWIVLWSPLRKINYIFVTGRRTLFPIKDNFVYAAEIDASSEEMGILPYASIEADDKVYSGVAIYGDTPGKTKGNIIAGYDIQEATRCFGEKAGFSSLSYAVFQEDCPILTEGIAKEWTAEEIPFDGFTQQKQKGEKWVVHAEKPLAYGEKMFYGIRRYELFFRSLENMIWLLGLVLILVLTALTTFTLVVRSMSREVTDICREIKKVGSGELKYHIRKVYYQNELNEIGNAINTMADTLQESINRANAYERQQAQAELRELQSKFNPHFLYNTLEIFRARCYDNGDEETADLIAETAAIFRGFISSETFIPIKEELAFGRKYLNLFKARYGESVTIRYDIDSEVLSYGIIRNSFQPLIENYFEHGFDPLKTDNQLEIAGNLQEDDTILFRVCDNGRGITEEELAEISAGLDVPIGSEKEKYGLRNLNQRLRLFYGESCGVRLIRQTEGICIEMTIRKISV